MKKEIYFRDTVTDGEKLTVDQAIDKLVSFHKGSSVRTVLDAFLNLKNVYEREDVVVIFSKGVNQSADCISMTCQNKDGSWISNSLIFAFTGQPMQHAS